MRHCVRVICRSNGKSVQYKMALKPFPFWIYLKKYKHIFSFLKIEIAHVFDFFSGWRHKPLNNMAADNMATEGARTLATMMYIYLSQNIFSFIIGRVNCFMRLTHTAVALTFHINRLDGIIYFDCYACDLFDIKPLSGPLLTKKTPSYGYRDPHDKPKTVWRPSQVYNGNPYTDKTASS